MTTPKKILIVDDEQSFRSILKMAITNKSLLIIEAASGEDGVLMARKHKPDLIIMDYKMPGINGWVAASQIKQSMPEVPIIGHTAYANPQNAQEGIDAGLTKILNKPVALNEWFAIFGEFLVD
jgi:CheY-like chemotaxis protein